MHSVTCAPKHSNFNLFTPKRLFLNYSEDLWAEHNLVVSPTRASKSAGWIILRVTVSIRAPLLEKPREIRGTTTPRIAAILISLEHSTWIVTATWSFQLIRALPVDICRTLDPTVARRSGTEVHGDIKPIDEGDVDEIQVVELVKPKFG